MDQTLPPGYEPSPHPDYAIRISDGEWMPIAGLEDPGPNGNRPAARTTPRRLVDGATFALDVPEVEPAIWGAGEQIAWAGGEACLFVGPQGVGKTTLAQRVILARIAAGDLLGLPVTSSDRSVLYVAADRPRQARRSLARMVGEADRDVLRERLRVWIGPLEFDVTAKPERLAAWCVELGVGTVVLDSLKDVAADLSKDETGNRLARAFGEATAAGIELLVLHHQRKATGDNRKPRALADVYGSTWITAAAGSVLLLWGEPGDPVVELRHLKQPAAEVGPLEILIDHVRGTVEIQEGSDLFSILRAASKGLTAKDAARVLYGTTDPKKAEDVRARRQLESLVARGLAHRRESDARSGAIKEPDVYFATTREPSQEALVR